MMKFVLTSKLYYHLITLFFCLNCCGIPVWAYASVENTDEQKSTQDVVRESTQAKEAETPESKPAGKPGQSAAIKNGSNRIVVPGVAPGALFSADTKPAEATNQALRVVFVLTALALVPAMLICMTAFLRIIIVLSMLRHAIGMQETPPNMALIGLSLFLTLFTMAAPLQKVSNESLQPFMDGKLTMQQAFTKANAPMREFMVKQTREQDLALMIELAKAPQPETIDDVSNLQLIPAFMLSELRAAFQIGFVVFLPFLLIDLIVSSILMALGMMMMPPVSISLPLKVLLFVLVDGWSLLLKALVGSFH